MKGPILNQNTENGGKKSSYQFDTIKERQSKTFTLQTKLKCKVKTQLYKTAAITRIVF